MQIFPVGERDSVKENLEVVGKNIITAQNFMYVGTDFEEEFAKELEKIVEIEDYDTRLWMLRAFKDLRDLKRKMNNCYDGLGRVKSQLDFVAVDLQI